MSAYPRQRRLILLCVGLAVAVALAVAVFVILPRDNGGHEPVQLAPVSYSAVAHVAVAPLLIVPVLDASGSMRSTDPTGLRFTSCDEMLKVVEAARLRPARTLVAPIFFGSRTVAVRPYQLGGDRSNRRLFFGGDLGDTNFSEALDRASTVASAFLGRPRTASGRVVVFILTDGVPDLGDGRPTAGLWPEIRQSVARLKSTGAELYLLGVTNSSNSWRSAAEQWRTLLGPARVHLVGSASGLARLYVSFAETALEIGKVQGTRLDAGEFLRTRAGNYTAACTIQATALQSRAAVSIQSSATAGTISAVLGSRGEQRTWRLPARPRESFVVHNVGSRPLLLSARTEAAVLKPTGQPTPCIGAPLDGLLVSLLSGSGQPITTHGSDPLALSAGLTPPQTPHGAVAAGPMQVHAYAPGRYTLGAPGRWQSGAYRLTVLTRSASGEVGRADYQIEAQLRPWANLVAPSRLTSLADASTVPLKVTLFLDKRAVRPRQVSASGGASVLAELCDVSGRVRASVWMTETSSGSLTASMPAVLHDGLLKLSVIDKQGRIASTRLLLWRMRPTFAQALAAHLSDVTVAVAIGIVLLSLGLVLWVTLKPALPGALVVTGAERPLRLEVLGRKFKFATVSDAAGSSRWLILPASRSSVRVVRLGLHLRSAIIRRGVETAFDGRIARLV
jgi:hypothetical protein